MGPSLAAASDPAGRVDRAGDFAAGRGLLIYPRVPDKETETRYGRAAWPCNAPGHFARWVSLACCRIRFARM